jgi:hypothetical protein
MGPEGYQWNPKAEPITGRTHEGIDVHAPYFLSFSLIDCGLYGFDWRDWGFEREHNYDAKGRKKPYYVLRLGRLHVTGGWLFDTDDFGAPEFEDREFLYGPSGEGE